jgi:hypothetical protein
VRTVNTGFSRIELVVANRGIYIAVGKYGNVIRLLRCDTVYSGTHLPNVS